MTYVLVTGEEILEIPVTPDGFAEFVYIARGRFSIFDRDVGPNDSRFELEDSFMSQVSAAASAYEIGAQEDLQIERFIANDFQSGTQSHDFARFNRELHAIMTRLQIAKAREVQKAQLALSDNAKSKVRFHIQQLRDRIDESTLPNGTKARLHKRLDELLAELSGRRLNLAAVMVGISGLFGVLGVAEADLIKLPDTIAAISRVLDEAQQYHDRLMAPVKRLTFDAVDDDDDEIPF